MALRPHLVHQCAHPLDRALEAAEDRLASEEMADIELDDGRDCGGRPDRVEAESRAGMACEPQVSRVRGRVDDALQLARCRRAAGFLGPGFAEGADMEL